MKRKLQMDRSPMLLLAKMQDVGYSSVMKRCLEQKDYRWFEEDHGWCACEFDVAMFPDAKRLRFKYLQQKWLAWKSIIGRNARSTFVVDVQRHEQRWGVRYNFFSDLFDQQSSEYSDTTSDSSYTL
jgi:hypothetical protein